MIRQEVQTAVTEGSAELIRKAGPNQPQRHKANGSHDRLPCSQEF